MNPTNFTQLKLAIFRTSLKTARAECRRRSFTIIFTSDPKLRPVDPPPPLAREDEVRLAAYDLNRYAGRAAAWAVLEAADRARAALDAWIKRTDDDGTPLPEAVPQQNPECVVPVPEETGDTLPRAIRRAAVDTTEEICRQYGFSFDLVFGRSTANGTEFREFTQKAASTLLDGIAHQTSEQLAQGARQLRFTAPPCEPRRFRRELKIHGDSAVVEWNIIINDHPDDGED